MLVEWKYTEKYGPRIVDPAKDKVRWNRYGAVLSAPDSPVRTDLVDFDVLLAEPFYQLVRQQLMAWQIERDQAHVADRVTVLHVHSPANLCYQRSIHAESLAKLGETVDEAWAKLLRGAIVTW